MTTRTVPKHRIENRNDSGPYGVAGPACAPNQLGGPMQSAMNKFDLTEYAPGCLLLRCTGGLSWEDRNLLAECVERRLATDNRCYGLIVDLEAVEFINSAGLGALFQLAQRLRSQDRRLVLARAQPTFTRLFQLAGLTRLARTADSFDDAARTLAQRDNDVEITMETESNGVVRR